MNRELGSPLAVGNEAELFAWGDKVLKFGRCSPPPSPTRDASRNCWP